MTMKLYSDSDIQTIADAIRSKTGSSDTYKVSEMAQAISDITGGYSLADLFNHEYAKEENVVIHGATSLMPYAFYQGTLKSFEADTMTHLGSLCNGRAAYAFAYCTDLESVSFPDLVSWGVDGYVFSNCIKLRSVYAPKAGLVMNLFEGCSSLVNVALGGDANGGSNGNAFKNCYSLQRVDLGVASLKSYEFRYCSAINTLVLRNENLVTLANINAFAGTPFASDGTGGTLYVPQSLITSYEADAKWATILGYANNSIVAIEGSQYEDYYVDGRPVQTS